MILSKLDIDKIKFQNQYKAGDALHRSAIILLYHPFSYCRVLMQLGYEPLKPILVDTLFGGSRYAYPSVFKYIKHIKSEDGFLGLFRGCGFNLCSELTKEFVEVNALDVCEQINKLQNEELDEKKKDANKGESSDEESRIEEKSSKSASFDRESILKLIRKLCSQTASKTIALTISYPFHVCFIRGCSQFIGRERIYNFNFTNLHQMVKQGNFYDGFIPKLIADLTILWLSSSLIFTVDALIEPDKFVLGYLSTFINFFVTTTMYPLQLTSTVMSVNHCSSLLASKIDPPFYNWRTCYYSLERRNQLKRGSSLIWRYVANAYKPQAIIRKYETEE